MVHVAVTAAVYSGNTAVALYIPAVYKIMQFGRAQAKPERQAKGGQRAIRARAHFATFFRITTSFYRIKQDCETVLHC